MEAELNKVLVTGGTGVVGHATATELLRRGYAVRLLSRHAADDVAAWDGPIEAYPADIGAADRVRGAADGCAAIIHVAGIVEESGDATFDRINVGGTENIVAEATRAGVSRLVFVSSLGAERGSSDYHQSKLAAEQVVQRFAGDWVIVRPGNVFGPGDEAVSLLLQMVRVLPVVPTIDGGDQPFQPIWHEDLAWALAECVARPDLVRRILDVAGPEQTTVNELIERFGELTGREPKRLPLPGLLAQIGAELASALGVESVVKPATVTMLLEGNVIQPGRPNGLTDVLGREVAPLRQRLAQLTDELPEQTPGEGVGKLQRQRYRVEIVGPQVTADTLLERFRERLDDFVPFDAEAEPASDSQLVVGNTISLALPPRGHAQVRVEDIDDDTITLATLAGHPLAGVIRFRFRDVEPDRLHFTIDIAERPASRLDQIGMALLGRGAQRQAWTQTAERVIAAAGGQAPDGVQRDTWELDEDAADRVDDWARDRINARLRAEHADGE
jgi:nucleoside-diphosphate-sugar epimerase